MKRKFMVYQRRDGFQIAEATGTRLENGPDFLARPHKSASWRIAAFNVVIDDGYELKGEEVVNCSQLTTQVLCFVEGVLTLIDLDQLHEEAHEMNGLFNSAAFRFNHFWISLSAAERHEAVDKAHAEALEINAAIESMIAGRQTIADNKPDFSQETWEIVRLGNAYKEAGREWYRWAKDAAIRLWENRVCAATH